MPLNVTELLAEEVFREVHKAPVSADFQIYQGRGWGTKEAGRVDFGTVHALDGQGSRSRDMGDDASKHLEVWWRIKLHLGPFEICECPVDIVGLPCEPETSPERRMGYKDGAPVSTDVCGGD